jgi:uncharacterized protein
MNKNSKDAAADRFWEKPLAQLNRTEWEMLCDGCGRCCLKKLEDEESQELAWTRVVCRYYDEEESRCSCYDVRTRLVPECVDVSQMDIAKAKWMPGTCAYRLRFEGKALPLWHPLLTGSRTKMEEAGISIAGRVVSEQFVHPRGYDEHIIRWVES